MARSSSFTERIVAIWFITFVAGSLCPAFAAIGRGGYQPRLLFSDDFQRTKLGEQWTVVDDPSPSGRSKWRVEEGKLVEESGIYRNDREYEFFQGTHIVAGSPDWTDYTLTASFTPTDDDGVGAIVRYRDKNNYYRFIMVEDTGNRGPFQRLERFLDGKRKVLAEVRKGFQENKTYALRMVAIGDRLEVWLDDKQILTAKDGSFPSGKIGFLIYAATLTVDQVRVVGEGTGIVSPPSPPPPPPPPPPPGKGKVLLEDDFQRKELGEQWTVLGDPSERSKWRIDDGKLIFDFLEGALIVAGSTDWTDYTLTARLTPTDDDYVGAIIRYKDRKNYYRFLMVGDPGNRGPCGLERVVNGKRTVLAEMEQQFQKNKTYALRMVAIGDRLEVWLDGKRILTARDDAIRSGKVGFISYRASLIVDDVRVTRGGS